MLRFHTLVCSIALFLMTQLSYAALPFAMDGEELPSLAPMLVDVQPAIVNIAASTQGQRSRRAGGVGSGVIVDSKNGYIVTNHHIINRADEILVTTKDGRQLEAELIGTDERSDVAVLKVEAKSLTEINLGVSENLRVGDFVVAIGSPFGLSQTVTSGIVSALGRSSVGIEDYEDFIQTDASINPGNSGGALVNLRGELVGINTAIISRTGGSVGIGFSIPVDMVKSLMEQLLEHGEVKRGLLGVRMQDLTPSLADAFGISGERGAVVSEVIAGSAAEEKGLSEGDVIVKFNDTDIDNSADLRNAVGLLRPGSKAAVEYYRDGKLESVDVKIKAFDNLATLDEGAVKRLKGARFKNVESGGAIQGVQVVEIKAQSAAASSGLMKNDIIVSINRQPITNLKEMQSLIKAAGDALLIKLIRNKRALFLVIQ